MDLAKFRLAGALWLSGTLVIHALVLWNTRDRILRGYPDFTIYYTAGAMVRNGLGRQLYDPARQFQIQKEFTGGMTTRAGALPFNHPPFEAVIFAPFSYLSYRSAYLSWCAANLMMLSALPYLLRPHIPVLMRLPGPVWPVAGLAFSPVFIALLQGQDSILLLFLYCLAYIFLKKGTLRLAGSTLACGLFKFHLVLPFLALLCISEKDAKRRRALLYGFFSVAVILVLVSIAVVGLQNLISYPHSILALEASNAGGAIRASDMPNLRGLLSLLLPGVSNLDLPIILLSVVVLLVAAWAARSAETDSEPFTFSLSLLATVLVSYHALGHDLSILVLPLILQAGWMLSDRVRWPRPEILIGCGALLFPPLQLVLAMRYHRLGWLVLGILLWFAGLVRTGTPRLAAQKVLS